MPKNFYSNYKTKCRGTLTCECGTKSKLCFAPTPGRGSQRVEGFQCLNCRKIHTLTIFDDGEIKGAEIKQRLKRMVPPTAPPETKENS
jgi:hypothetical protein